MTVELLEDRSLPATGLSAAIVADIVPGALASDPMHLTNVNGTLFFTAYDAIHGRELWKSDGTADGTVLVKDIWPGSGSSNLSDRYHGTLTNVGGTLYFTAHDGVHGLELWKSDGTTAGTVLVKDINSGAPHGVLQDIPLTAINGTLFFGAYDQFDGRYSVNGALWRSDGTADGTVLVKDIDPSIGRVAPTELTNIGGTLYVDALGELWKSDGTATGTVLVKDIYPGNTGSGPEGMTEFNGGIFFAAADDVHNIELWKTDGTAAGTTLVKDIYRGAYSSNPHRVTSVNGLLFFSALDKNGYELWKTDGTAAGTTLVKDIFRGVTKYGMANASEPSNLTNLNGRLIFTAQDGVYGRELWTSDGSKDGTVLLKDISPGTASSSPSELTIVNGLLYFAGASGPNGRELWQSDGTAAGTVLVQDINPGSASSDPRYLVGMNNKLYFSADDGTHGRELWDPPPVPPSYTPDPLVQVSSTSLFADCTADNPQPETVRLNQETEPYLAVDPTNPNHLVGLWHQDERAPADVDGFRGQILGMSWDGGKNWQLSALPGITLCSGGTLPQAADPWLTFAPNGDLYASSMALQGLLGAGLFDRSQILVSKSTDGGRNWSTPAVLIDDANGAFNDKESITADPADPLLAYAVWHRQEVPAGFVRRSSPVLLGLTGVKGPSLFTRTTDGGQTWEPARVIYDPGANAITGAHQIVVRPDGALLNFFSEVVAFRDSDGQLSSTLSLIWSPDKGQTWLPHGRPVRAAQLQGVLVTDPDTGILVETSVVPPGVTAAFDVTVDPNTGYLYAVWEDARFSGGQYNSIAFSQSTDGGLTWSAPIAINQTPTTVAPGNRHAFVPSIAVADDGTVAVTYYDYRSNDAGPDLPTEYWLVHGRPTTPTALTNPANWGNEVRLTDQSFDLTKGFALTAYWLGHYQGLAAAGNDFVTLFAQGQSSDDPSSIFFRRVTPLAALRAAGGTGAAAGGEALTLGQVRLVLGEAVARWQVAGVHAAALGLIDVGIMDLRDDYLGLAGAGIVWLDANAAGHGWFIDPTPWDDAEFTTPGDQDEENRVDLLTVLAHEIGHLLGLDHDVEGIMAEALAPGVRRLPVPLAADDVFAGAVASWSLAWDDAAISLALDSAMGRNKRR